MERVAFLVEETNERLGCLLNPDNLVMRRIAGVVPRRSTGGQFTGSGLQDDPLLYTGGGKTVLEFHLLFDVSLAGSSIETGDVRDLTAPLWNLAENTQHTGGSRRPPLVRFVWGKSWNIPGIVASVAERLEDFTAGGAPQRSWLSMRLWRVSDPPRGQKVHNQELATVSPVDVHISPESVPATRVQTHLLIAGERLDSLAARYYPDLTAVHGPVLWRAIASFNNLQDPLHIPAGSTLRIPLPGALAGGAV